MALHSRGMDIDVVVIGGGAAGLSGALTLARARRSVLVVDDGKPRNAPAAGVHGYLGRDGVQPADLLAAGRAEVESYGGELRVGRVRSARADAGGFVVDLDDGSSVQARRLLIATGLLDELPDVTGLRERWGRDVLHCPYCHGWEVRDRSIAVLATGPMAAHQALLFRQWSDEVVLLQHTGPEPTDEELEQLSARGVRRAVGVVQQLVVEDDALTGALLDDGKVVPCEAVVVLPRFTARTAGLEGLGLTAQPMVMGEYEMGTHLQADPSGATDVPGVWVAGNASDVMAQVIHAAGAGVRAGAAINFDLVQEEARRAVEAQRLAS